MINTKKSRRKKTSHNSGNRCTTPSKNQKQQKSNKKRLKIKPFPDGFFRIELAKTENFEGLKSNILSHKIGFQKRQALALDFL